MAITILSGGAIGWIIVLFSGIAVPVAVAILALGVLLAAAWARGVKA